MRKRFNSFTLAEVLITLGIIGIVAAMTLPGVMYRYRKTEIETRLKRVYSIMNQAVLQSIAKDTWSQPPTDKRYDNDALLEWMQIALLPYLNNVEIAKNQTAPFLPSGRLRIKLNDGSTLYFDNNAQIHVNLDINGDKKPNKGGIDLFYFFLDFKNSGRGYFYPSGYAYSNLGHKDTYTDNYVYGNREGMIKYCRSKVREAGNTCALLIMYDGWKIEKDYPINFK